MNKNTIMKNFYITALIVIAIVASASNLNTKWKERLATQSERVLRNSEFGITIDGLKTVHYTILIDKNGNVIEQWKQNEIRDTTYFINKKIKSQIIYNKDKAYIVRETKVNSLVGKDISEIQIIDKNTIQIHFTDGIIKATRQ